MTRKCYPNSFPSHMTKPQRIDGEANMLHGDLDSGMTLHLLLENKYTRWFALLNAYWCMVENLLGLSGELIGRGKMLDSNEVHLFLHVSS